MRIMPLGPTRHSVEQGRQASQGGDVHTFYPPTEHMATFVARARQDSPIERYRAQPRVAR